MAEPLDTFLRLRARLSNVHEESGWILGGVDVSAADHALNTVLDRLQEAGVVAEIHQEGALVFPGGLKEGLASLRIDSGLLPGYFESYDSLLAKHPVDPPERWSVWQDDAGLTAGCRAAWTLLQFLRGKVEVWDETQMRFFLVDQHAIEVPLNYSAESARGVSASLPQVKRFLDSDHLDVDARWAFFRKSASRFLAGLLAEERLGSLLANLGQVFTRTVQDHSLYLERFSFEDLLKTFDEKRLKFIGDLNLVLSGLQTASAAVPVAFFLVAEKFKPADGFVGQNVIMGVGGIVFCALLFVFSLNQGLTLEEIRKALRDFEAEQLRKQSERSGRLKSLMEGTWAQYRKVRHLLWTVRILLLCFAIVIGATFVWCSVPSVQKRWPYLAPVTPRPSQQVAAPGGAPPNP